MTLRICTCGKLLTTKTVRRLGLQEGANGKTLLLGDCLYCLSSIAIVTRKTAKVAFNNYEQNKESITKT